MNTKKLTALTLVALSATALMPHSFATGDIVDLGSDTANTTSNTATSWDGLSLGDTTTNTTSTTTGWDSLSLGSDSNSNTTNTNTDNWNWWNDLNLWGWNDTATNTENTPTYEKVDKKENAYKFNMFIKDPTKSYVVKFATGNKDLVLSNFIINNNNVSDNLKKSLTIVLKKGDKTTVVKMSDLDIKPINVSKDAEVYLVYNPDGVDNSSELALSNNNLDIYADEFRQPAQEGELNYNNGQIDIVNPVDYKEAKVNYEVKPELIKTVTATKTALTKKDTWPVENTVALVLAMLLVITGIAMMKKEENA